MCTLLCIMLSKAEGFALSRGFPHFDFAIWDLTPFRRVPLGIHRSSVQIPQEGVCWHRLQLQTVKTFTYECYVTCQHPGHFTYNLLLMSSLFQWSNHPQSGVHGGWKSHVGHSLQRAQDPVPDSRLPWTQPGFPPAGEVLWLQGRQHPTAGGRLPLPTV